MFEDRTAAGNLLADRILFYSSNKTVVYAIPRGGVIVGKVIANRLHTPFFLVNVKKIGVPNNPELALGAVSSLNSLYIDRGMVKRIGLSKDDLRAMISSKRKELGVREKLFSCRYPRTLKCKRVLLVDDGIATGATIEAALIFLKKKKPERIVLVTPVIASDTYDELLSLVDDIIALEIAEGFSSVGQFYKDFSQVSDEDVLEIIS